MKFNRFERSTNQCFMYTNSTALQGADNALQANNQRTIKTNSNKLHTAQEREFIMGVPSTIGKNGMCVTLGGKHDGYCPISDIGDAKVGERTLFKVMSSNNEDAMPTLSRSKAQLWESITSLAQSAEPTLVKVLKVAHGKNGNAVTGLSVMFEDGAAKGTIGHMPSWELARNTDLNSLVGQVIAAAVTEVAPHKGGKNGLVLLSHTRAFGENTKAAVSHVKIGEPIEAKVLKFINAAKNDEHPSVLVTFTKNVEVDGVEEVQHLHAIIHKTEVKGYPHKKATDFLKVGDTIKTQVLRASTEKRTVVLGMRAEERAEFLSQIEAGHVLVGTIARSLPGVGFFVDLGSGIEGFLRVQSLRSVNKQPETLKIGSEVKVVVLVNDRVKDKLLLGRRELPAQYL
jgi:ribosomal protein S1